MKEIYRYRVDPRARVFAVDVDGRGENRAGFIASMDSIGPAQPGNVRTDTCSIIRLN